MDNQTLVDIPAEKIPADPVLLRGHITGYIDFELDVRSLREKMGEEAWKNYTLENGYQEWERGAVIAWDHISDNLELDLLSPHVKIKWSDIDDIDFRPRWSEELAEQLDLFPKDDAAIAAVVDN